MSSSEINFDGLVGPTHNYGGLSYGNVASTANAALVSEPKKAALQGLKKMKFLLDMGLKQAVLPPHERPYLRTLRKLGFTGTDTEILNKVYREDVTLLANCSSASAMWTANAATISPSRDCPDARLHITPANLSNKFHRSLEPETTGHIFKTIFNNEKHFFIHAPLPANAAFGDEGAANHTRFCKSYGDPGLELFNFGRYSFLQGKPKPKFFPARHTFEASQAVVRLHGLDPTRVMLAQQSPIAIDAGVFHNDVISVGNQNVLIYHEQAFFDVDKIIDELNAKFNALTGENLILVKVTSHEITVQEAVQTYLFNSQLVTLPTGEMALISPKECEDNRVVRKCVERILSNNDNPVKQVHYLDLRQSMNNGGGPACLRLRVVLSDEEIAALGAKVMMDGTLYSTLINWVEKNYRDELKLADLADPNLLSESRTALDELTQILKLGSIYDFQK